MSNNSSQILPIFLYPNEVLLKKCEPLNDIDQDLINLALKMKNTMTNARGVGLAAPQIGLNIQLMVVVDTIMFNPVINHVSDETYTPMEGCLSIPGVRMSLKRFNNVVASWIDVNGDVHDNVELDQHYSHVFQHEIDHLHGKLIIDSLINRPEHRNAFNEKIGLHGTGVLIPHYEFHKNV